MIEIGAQTEQQREELAQAYEFHAALCQMLAGLYRSPLTEEVAKRLSSIDLKDSGDDLVLTEGGCLEGLALMQEYCKVDGFLGPASDDFHDLFVGPHKLIAAPWSSVYLDPRGLLFGPTAMEVKGIYSAHGFEIPEGTAEPSDHVAYEWQFLADMHKRAARACRASSQDETLEVHDLAQGFFEKYLYSWMTPFCDKVEGGCKTSFYRGLAAFTRGITNIERNLLLN